MKYVLVEVDDISSGGVFLLGIYDNIYTAIGHAMKQIWEFGESYKNDGDTFEYSEFYDAEGDCGLVCEVKYKHEISGDNEPYTDYFYILFNEESEECGKK